MISDAEYRTLLDRLAKNEFVTEDFVGVASHPALAQIAETALDRLKTGSVPVQYHACTDCFYDYFVWVNAGGMDKDADNRIARAATALADALADSGRSNYFSMLDPQIWSRSLGSYRYYHERIDVDVLGHDVHLPIETYLREMASSLIDFHEFVAEQRGVVAGDWLSAARVGKSLSRFVIRAVRIEVEQIAELDGSDDALPDDWRPKPRIDETDTRTPSGWHVITARLSEILLAEPVSTDTVKNALYHNPALRGVNASTKK